MGRCGRAFAYAARLEHVIERQLLRNSLRFDPHRSRSDHRQPALAEIAATAAVVDDRGVRSVADDVPRAILPAMFELSQLHHVGKTLAERCFRTWGSRDLPQAWARPGNRSRKLKGTQREDQSNPRSKDSESLNSVHSRHLSWVG